MILSGGGGLLVGPKKWVKATRRVVAKFRQNFGKISPKFRSFSAVSAPIFASKYAFCSIFQNLPDYQAEIFEIWQNFANFATFAKFLKKSEVRKMNEKKEKKMQMLQNLQNLPNFKNFSYL